MPLKDFKHYIEGKERKVMLDKLEANVNLKIGDKSINKLYKEKLKDKLDLDESITTVIKNNPAPKKKKEKPVKEISEKGKKASERLSKYRQQVREALELKKSIESKNSLIYDDDEDDDEDEQSVVAQSAPIIAPSTPSVDLDKVYNEIDALKKQNKTLEERLLFRRDVLGISDMRRQMLIKF